MLTGTERLKPRHKRRMRDSEAKPKQNTCLDSCQISSPSCDQLHILGIHKTLTYSLNTSPHFLPSYIQLELVFYYFQPILLTNTNKNTGSRRAGDICLTQIRFLQIVLKHCIFLFVLFIRCLICLSLSILNTLMEETKPTL